MVAAATDSGGGVGVGVAMVAPVLHVPGALLVTRAAHGDVRGAGGSFAVSLDLTGDESAEVRAEGASRRRGPRERLPERVQIGQLRIALRHRHPGRRRNVPRSGRQSVSVCRMMVVMPGRRRLSRQIGEQILPPDQRLFPLRPREQLSIPPLITDLLRNLARLLDGITRFFVQ